MSSRVLRHQTEAASLFGARIDIEWPLDETFYPATVVGYDPCTRRHKMLYDYDDSIEEVCLRPRGKKANTHRRPWKLLASPACQLAGMKILLPVQVDGGQASVAQRADFTACVLGDCEDGQGKGNQGTEHRVLFLENDVIAFVDLAEVRYTELDKITGEPVRDVNVHGPPVRLFPVGGADGDETKDGLVAGAVSGETQDAGQQVARAAAVPKAYILEAAVAQSEAALQPCRLRLRIANRVANREATPGDPDRPGTTAIAALTEMQTHPAPETIVQAKQCSTQLNYSGKDEIETVTESQFSSLSSVPFSLFSHYRQAEGTSHTSTRTLVPFEPHSQQESQVSVVPAASVAHIHHRLTAAMANDTDSETETVPDAGELSGANSGPLLPRKYAKSLEGKLIEFWDDVSGETNTALVSKYDKGPQTHYIFVFEDHGDRLQTVYLTKTNCTELEVKKGSESTISPRDVRARRRQAFKE